MRICISVDMILTSNLLRFGNVMKAGDQSKIEDIEMLRRENHKRYKKLRLGGAVV